MLQCLDVTSSTNWPCDIPTRTPRPLNIPTTVTIYNCDVSTSWYFNSVTLAPYSIRPGNYRPHLLKFEHFVTVLGRPPFFNWIVTTYPLLLWSEIWMFCHMSLGHTWKYFVLFGAGWTKCLFFFIFLGILYLLFAMCWGGAGFKLLICSQVFYCTIETSLLPEPPLFPMSQWSKTGPDDRTHWCMNQFCVCPSLPNPW
jgi:hypothetical protein